MRYEVIFTNDFMTATAYHETKEEALKHFNSLVGKYYGVILENFTGARATMKLGDAKLEVVDTEATE